MAREQGFSGASLSGPDARPHPDLHSDPHPSPHTDAHSSSHSAPHPHPHPGPGLAAVRKLLAKISQRGDAFSPDGLTRLLRLCPLGVALLRDDETIYANASLAALFEQPPEEMAHWRFADYLCRAVGPEGAKIGEEFTAWFGPDERPAEWSRRFAIQAASGRTKWVEAFVSSEPKSLGGLRLLLIMEMTDWVGIEAEAARWKERYRALTDQSPDCTFITDADGCLLYANAEMARRFGIKPGDIVGKTQADLFPPESALRLRAAFQQVIEFGLAKIQIVRIHFPSGERWLEERITPLSGSDAGSPAALVVWRDLTALRASEDAARRGNLLFRAVFDQILDGLGIGEVLFDPHGKAADMRWLDVNPAFERLTGLRAEEIVGRKVSEALPEHDAYWEEFLGRVVTEQTPLGFESWLVPFQRFLRGTAVPLEQGRFLLTFEDVTDERAKADRLNEALQEKSVLIRELHHRVWNNLQWVSSLAKLHAGGDGVANACLKLQHRIRAMAVIYESLLQAENFLSVDARKQFERLWGHALVSEGTQAGLVEHAILGEACAFDIDTLSPLGFLVYEVYANALRHGFPAHRRGRVETVFEKLDSAHFRLTIRDDGVGCQAGVDLLSSRGMGFALIRLMAEQLDGTLAVQRRSKSGGTVVRLEFKAQKYASRV